MTGARCNFCGRTFRNQQAVRAHLKACPAYRHLPKALVPSIGSAPRTSRVSPSTPVPRLTREPMPAAEHPGRQASRPARAGDDGAIHQILRRAAIQSVKNQVIDAWWSPGHTIPSETKAQALAAIERELSRLPTHDLPQSELVTIAVGIRDGIYGPVLAAQQRAREKEDRQRAQAHQRPLRLAAGALHATRLLRQHPDLDGRTRVDLERTVRQALDQELDGSESEADVQTRVEKILADALGPIRQARRETVRQALIAHGVEYATQELAQEEDLTAWARASIGQDVKRALEDEIGGEESESDVEALVDDLLNDVLGEAEDDETEDDD
jgi:hypothetical protein